ncbi:MAG: YdeI/OmpD-associated family protein [Acidobacteria bacterium]|nr:YdeI/OmpD-associated family protein [Acidobacteriota bacterium]
MPVIDKRVDEYIERAAEFAQPILAHFRDLVHTACPEVKESIKWGAPHFDYKGNICGMAAFKAHCAFGFWKHKLLDQKNLNRDAMGSFGRITSLKDLPEDKTILSLIHQAMELNEKGVKLPKKKPAERKELVVPDELAKELKKNRRSQAAWDNFSYSHRKEYIEWINEAKTAPTRERRIATTIEWVSEGKGRNWKYEKC